MIGYFGLLIKFIESEVGTCSSYMLQFLIVVHVSRISVAELCTCKCHDLALWSFSDGAFYYVWTLECSGYPCLVCRFFSFQ